MIKVIDSFLPETYADEIEQTLTRYDFQWYLYIGSSTNNW